MRRRLERGPVDYQVARSNEQWIDHRQRTLVTGAAIAWQRPESILDPACGDGSIVAAALRSWEPQKVMLADISQANIDGILGQDFPPFVSAHVGNIDETIAEAGPHDMVVLTEILEHIEDPDQTLRLARQHARILVASSPEMRPGQIDTNPEHLWQFDGDGYAQMLMETGWRPFHKVHLAFFGLMYDFGIWVCG